MLVCVKVESQKHKRQDRQIVTKGSISTPSEWRGSSGTNVLTRVVTKGTGRVRFNWMESRDKGNRYKQVNTNE